MMNLRKILLISMGLSLSACATAELPSRNSPFETLPTGSAATAPGYVSLMPAEHKLQSLEPQNVVPVVAVDALGADENPAGALPEVSIAQVTVRVPRSLKVSEANRYLPKGDIVWREDPIGDRHAQVQTIVQAAMERGVAALQGPVEADLEIEVTRFHALTEKARYTTGGVHAISFIMTLRNSETGEVLIPAREIEANFKAYGGQRALLAMSEGRTQKVRITEHLAAVIQQEILRPGTREPYRGGLILALNRF